MGCILTIIIGIVILVLYLLIGVIGLPWWLVLILIAVGILYLIYKILEEVFEAAEVVAEAGAAVAAAGIKLLIDAVNYLIDDDAIKNSARMKCPEAFAYKIKKAKANSVEVGLFSKTKEKIADMRIDSSVGVSNNLRYNELIPLDDSSVGVSYDLENKIGIFD